VQDTKELSVVLGAFSDWYEFIYCENMSITLIDVPVSVQYNSSFLFDEIPGLVLQSATASLLLPVWRLESSDTLDSFSLKALAALASKSTGFTIDSISVLEISKKNKRFRVRSLDCVDLYDTIINNMVRALELGLKYPGPGCNVQCPFRKRCVL
jgi:hypothetical protein